MPRRSRLTAAALVVLLAVGVQAASAGGHDPIDLPGAPPVVLEGAGWGHGVGMSQYGAYAMAKAGKSASAILKHYYQGVKIGTAENPDVRISLDTSAYDTDVKAVTGDGPLPWVVCDPLCGAPVAIQPLGRTWTVSRDGGTMRIAGDTGSTVWSGSVPPDGGLRAMNGPAGVVVEAPNPNGRRRTYRWGLLEFTPKPNTTTRSFLVAELSLEDYIRGLGEVPSSWGANGGKAALAAQAITGRTYALRQHRANKGHSSSCDCSLLATPANQTYIGYEKETGPSGTYWVDAVENSFGKVATSNGELIYTYYSSSHGHRSENIEDSWAYGSTSFPYLKSVSDEAALADDIGNPYRHWSRTVGNATFAGIFGLDDVRRIQVLDETDGGTPRTLRVTGRDGGAIRTLEWGGHVKGIAGASLLRSSALGWGGTRLLPSQHLTRLALGPFSDDDGNPAEWALSVLADAGVIQDCGDGKVCPAGTVTRAELAQMLVAAFKDLVPKSGPTGFTDVPSSHPAAGAIKALAEAGITNGCDASRFCPNAKVTREQAATFVVRAFGLDPVPGDRFSDVPPRDPHRDNINAVVDAGLAEPCGPNTFCPTEKVTRGQLAAVLYDLMT